ncbi:DivIVA domain-containing protein [Lentilactobacillus farraginis]|uniref:Cell division initiation protein DivIVA n=1 Tax=Lentilactobacillus farraginis DSM 18382 = JCM 14108 TaxID=1423743 RepID=X0QAY9_9LACO|nr:DivIVA domain-containing protein [Lentilactobacillus farraginis]KRM01014.1 cell division initiation protein DivIVA [Lentilactobacillus farraginis DSM 18382 = JCM 14108]GAF35775.1 cell division initiation protein DivIVA [Lentilactobacillus farraginis DSM 18382 = JCM 14108]
MVLSPQDIHNKEFSTKLRGYNIDEVNDFLDQIIKDYQIILEENKDLRSQLSESKDKLSYFNDLKDSLNQSILVAQEAADKVKSNSKKEAEITNREAQKKADDIIQTANEKSNHILEEASKRAKKLAIETDDLKKNTRVFRQRLEVMLESQLAVIKGADWDRLVEDGPTTTYEDIEKVVGDLDNSANSDVKSETKQGNRADAVENTPAADHDNLQTVVIYPDNQNKNN